MPPKAWARSPTAFGAAATSSGVKPSTREPGRGEARRQYSPRGRTR